MKNNAIGVFDSGIGGLSVLSQLTRFMPDEKYIYLGDTARVPYGSKSNDIVKLYAEECTRFLIAKDVKLIVVACNTVSSVALEKVIETAGEIPVVGMIEPAAQAAIRSTNNNNIGVIGTRATITSEAYPNGINAFTKEVNVFSQACPLFVPIIEEGMMQHPATKLIANDYLQGLLDNKIDTLILGCTHYPLLKQLFSELIPQISLIDSGEHAAVNSLRLLAEQDSLAEKTEKYHKKPNIEFFVTDVPTLFYDNAVRFLGYEVSQPIKVEL